MIPKSPSSDENLFAASRLFWFINDDRGCGSNVNQWLTELLHWISLKTKLAHVFHIKSTTTHFCPKLTVRSSFFLFALSASVSLLSSGRIWSDAFCLQKGGNKTKLNGTPISYSGLGWNWFDCSLDRLFTWSLAGLTWSSLLAPPPPLGYWPSMFPGLLTFVSAFTHRKLNNIQSS